MPIVGITSTPVLDPNTGLLYVTPHVEIQQNPGSPKTYVYEIAAIDVATGQTVLGPQVISATTVQSDGSIVSNGVSVPGTGLGVGQRGGDARRLPGPSAPGAGSGHRTCRAILRG